MVKRTNVCKFPVARIKKIMQADEDVGKVAQATPIVVSKSLELFMQNILDATVQEVRNSGQRKITPAHFKRAIHNNETFDFLKDIVENVKDDGGQSGAAVASSAGEPKAKKRRTAKAEDSD